MEWLTTPFEQAFMQRALVAGLLTVFTAALVGVWVILRGLSFMGDAMAHGVLPGIALAFVLGFDLTLGAVVAAAAMVAGIGLVHRRGGLSEDTGIGLLFVGMLALGVIVMSKSPSYAGSLTGFLFGDPLGVRTGDLALQAVVLVVTAIAVALLYRPFLALSFDPAKADVLGLAPRLAHLAMLSLLAATIAVSFRTVGNLLVFGLLVAPPAAASLVARRLPTMILTAGLLGAIAVVGGLLLSWYAGTAAGATIAGMAVVIFFLVLIAREASRAVGARRLRVD